MECKSVQVWLAPAVDAMLPQIPFYEGSDFSGVGKGRQSLSGRLRGGKA